jgi:co-chaperonin GroES (HSP10)
VLTRIRSFIQSPVRRVTHYGHGKRIDLELKVGDKVLYGKYSGTEVTLDDSQYLILRESDVLAVIG